MLKANLASAIIIGGAEKLKDGVKNLGETLKSLPAESLKLLGSGIKELSEEIIKIGTEALKTGMSFDSAMSQLAATLGITSADIQSNIGGAGDMFETLREKAREMGSATVFSAQESAEALNILAMSGFSAEESMSMVEDVLHLAAAGSMDMASAAGYVSGAMKGFNDATKDAGYYADLMAKGATLANTNVQELGDAMSSGAATASAYGQSADSMTLSLLRLAEQEVTGSAAGTALAAAMKNLYTPSDQAKKALKELGVAAYDEAGAALDFNDVVNSLAAAFSGMSEEQANAYKQTIFGIQGLEAFNKMTVTGVEKQEEWAAALSLASDGIGEAAKQYDTMTDNMEGDLKKLSAAFDDLMIEVSDALGPSARLILSGFTELLSGNVDEGIDLIMQGIDSLDELLQSLGPTAKAALDRFLDTFAEHFPDVAESGVELLLQLVVGICRAFPELIPAAAEAVKVIGDTLWDNRGLIVEAGENLIRGLWEGIKSLGPWLLEKAGALVSEIMGLFTGKEGFDTHSPSKWSEGVFRNVMEGAAIGLEEGSEAASSAGAAAIERIIEAVESKRDELEDELTTIAAIVSDTFKELTASLDLKTDISELEYQLWERQYDAGNTALRDAEAELEHAKEFLESVKDMYADSEDADAGASMIEAAENSVAALQAEYDALKDQSELEKYTHKQEMLAAQMENQVDVVSAAEAAYQAIAEQYGENSEESLRYQKQLLQEQIELQKLRDTLAEVAEARQALYEVDDTALRASAMRTMSELATMSTSLGT